MRGGDTVSCGMDSLWSVTDVRGMPALGGVALLLIRWWLIGTCWSWRGWVPMEGRAGSWHAPLHVVMSVLLGLVLNTLLVAFLLGVGHWTLLLDWGGALLLMCAGAWWGRGCGAGRVRPSRATLAWLLILVAACCALLAVPQRGEWMVGGWDPGIYVQQAVTLAQEGQWRARPDEFWAALPAADLPVFTRPSFNFLQAYPVVPVDPARRSLEPFFFPFTPVVMAQLARAGGLAAVCRTNEFIGLLAALGLAAAAWRMTHSRLLALGVLALVATHPIWLYHLHFPTSEVVQVLLLAGLAWGLARARRTTADVAGLAVLFLAAGLNRLAFLPFAALLLVADALYRPAAPGRAWWLLALAVAALLDAAAVPITIGRLGRSVTTLLVATAFLGGGALLAGAWCRRRAARPALRVLQGWAVPAGTIAACILFWLLWQGRERLPELLEAGAWNARLMWAYGLPVVVVLAALGLIVGGRLSRCGGGIAWRCWLAFLLAAAALTSLTPEIARIAPWAVRRQVEYALPLLALGAGGLVAWLAYRIRPRALALTLAAIAGAVLLAAQVPRGLVAWRATEYDGLDQALRLVVAQLDERDVVVADHFKWATPLRRIYGRHVLNGEVWCDPPRPEDFQRALAWLAEWARARGGRLLVLTSTGDGVEVFPPGLEAPAEIWRSPPWRYREVVHSARARTIETRDKEKTFRLYQVAAPGG
jgi:hypothetical protein